jgi:hypothetical protein
VGFIVLVYWKSKTQDAVLLQSRGWSWAPSRLAAIRLTGSLHCPSVPARSICDCWGRRSGRVTSRLLEYLSRLLAGTAPGTGKEIRLCPLCHIWSPVRTGPGAHTAFYTVGTGSSRGVKWPGSRYHDLSKRRELHFDTTSHHLQVMFMFVFSHNSSPELLDEWR